MKVDDLNYYVNVCFNDLNMGTYYQTSDPKIMRSLGLKHIIKEGNEITIKDKRVKVREVQALLLDETDDYSLGARTDIYGREIPFITQIIIYTEDVK